MASGSSSAAATTKKVVSGVVLMVLAGLGHSHALALLVMLALLPLVNYLEKSSAGSRAAG